MNVSDWIVFAVLVTLAGVIIYYILKWLFKLFLGSGGSSSPFDGFGGFDGFD